MPAMLPTGSPLPRSRIEAPELPALELVGGGIRPERDESLVKRTLTPVPLLQRELTALLAPETKLTAAHFAKRYD
jgi:hypothetical protein